MTRKPNTDKLFNRLVTLETLMTFNDHLIEFSVFAEEFFKLSKTVKIKSINAFPLWKVFISPCQKKLTFGFKDLTIYFHKPESYTHMTLSVSLQGSYLVPPKTMVRRDWDDAGFTYGDIYLTKGIAGIVKSQRDGTLISLRIYREENKREIPPRPGSEEERYFKAHRKLCKDLRDILLSLDYDNDGFFRGLVKKLLQNHRKGF